MCWFIHSRWPASGPIWSKFCRNPRQVPNISAKFQVCWFIHSKDLAILKKKPFSRPHQPPDPNFGETRYTFQIFTDTLPLSTIRPARVKYFLIALDLKKKKLQVSRLIHSKVMTMFRKTVFKDPFGPWSKFSEI